jgi:hypothetical protein
MYSPRACFTISDIERMALAALKDEDLGFWDHERLPTLLALMRYLCLDETKPVVLTK